MTEAPDVYPDFPDDYAPETEDQDVEGLVEVAEPAQQVQTGDPRVDAVMVSLGRLDDRPVGEHAALFAGAHEQLRAALDPDRQPA